MCFRYGNREFFNGLFLVILGVAGIQMGTTSNLTGHHTLNAVIGLTVGAIQTGTMLTLAKLWPKKSAPFFMLGSLSWKLGAANSPLLYKNFLSPEKNGNSPPEESRIYIPYAINGSIIILNGLVICVLWVYSPLWMHFRNAKNEEEAGDSAEEEEEEEEEDGMSQKKMKFFTSNRSTNRYNVSVTTLSLVMVLLYLSIHIVFSQFLVPFLITSDVHMEKLEAVKVLTGALFSYMTGTLLGFILSSLKVKAVPIILFSIISMFASNIVLLTIGRADPTLVWVCICGMNLSAGPLYAAILACLQERVGVNSVISGLYTAAGIVPVAIGLPILVSYHVETDPYFLVYGNLVCYGLISVCLLAIALLDSLKEGWSKGQMDVDKE